MARKKKGGSEGRVDPGWRRREGVVMDRCGRGSRKAGGVSIRDRVKG